MAVYKVPQDVEADDKLLGPLSFRQFIYAVVAVIGCGIAFFLSQLFIGLIIIPLPVIALFTILALPLRKDQPMEMYLVAIIRFMLKPRLRLWQPEGVINLVEIVAPRVVEEQRTKGLSQDEARSRLDYLAQVMDTRGWSVKGSSYPGMPLQGGFAVSDGDLSNDIMDKDASIARSFDSLLAKKDAERQQYARAQMAQVGNTSVPAQNPGPIRPGITLDDLISRQQQTPPADLSSGQASIPSTAGQAADQSMRYDPYPKQIHQQMIRPLGSQQPQRPPQTPPALRPVQQPAKITQNHEQNQMTSTISPDIMRLATESKNLSISTLANEAHRLEQKHDESQEVIVSLH